jgi:hypothetical protein
MIIYSETQDLRVLIDTDALSMIIEKRLGDEWVETTSDTYPNLKALSSDFRCDIGFGPAYDILMEHDVPKDSDMWHLNHSNPWRD